MSGFSYAALDSNFLEGLVTYLRPLFRDSTAIAPEVGLNTDVKLERFQANLLSPPLNINLDINSISSL